MADSENLAQVGGLTLLTMKKSGENQKEVDDLTLFAEKIPGEDQKEVDGLTLLVEKTSGENQKDVDNSQPDVPMAGSKVEDSFDYLKRPLKSLNYLFTLDNDTNRLRMRCPLDDGCETIELQRGLGILEELPSEILTCVLDQLDLQSLVDFRRVNHQSNQFVDSLPKYKVIVEHAPDVLRGMLTTETASLTTLEVLYGKLCQRTCDSCSQYGDFLYVLTCKRVCIVCLATKSSYKTLRKADLIRKFDLKPKLIANITRMQVRCGCYRSIVWSGNAAVTLYDHDFAQSVAIAAHGSMENMERSVKETMVKRWPKYEEKRFAWKDRSYRGKRPRAPDESDDEYTCWLGHDEIHTFRFMAAVMTPYFNQQTSLAEWSFLCEGCKFEHSSRMRASGFNEKKLYEYRMFTNETFASHMKQWGEVSNAFHILSPKHPNNSFGLDLDHFFDGFYDTEDSEDS